MITEEIATATDDHSMSGAKALIFLFLTCGLYAFFWYYIVGQKLADLQHKHNLRVKDDGILYIVLSIFGFSLIADAIIQNEMNKFVSYY